MKYAALIVWLLTTPFLLKSFDLLPYGGLFGNHVYSWNGGLTISTGNWRMIYLTHGWPTFGRLPVISVRSGDGVPKGAFEWLDQNVPDWQDRLNRGETITIPLRKNNQEI